MIGKMKLRKTDTLYTRYVRERDDYTCQRCRRPYPKDNCRNLVTSHFWGRGRENTRFDDENCMALCQLPCHQYWGHGEGRVEYQAFMEEKLGQAGYDNLMVRAHTYKKQDDKMDEFVIRRKMEQLGQQRQPILASKEGICTNHIFMQERIS